MVGIADMILDEKNSEKTQGANSDQIQGPPPIHGYRPLPQDAIGTVNAFKVDEELLLRKLDALAQREDIDKRWLVIGRTRLEEAFMAINRSVFQPTRLQM